MSTHPKSFASVEAPPLLWDVEVEVDAPAEASVAVHASDEATVAVDASAEAPAAVDASASAADAHLGCATAEHTVM